jgi:hypothetical protein
MRRVLFILCVTYAYISGLPVLGQHYDPVSGRVVAYSGALTCLNGNGYWSMVIRIQKPENGHPKFIRVDFSLPCEKSPEWSTKPAIQKFHLFRQKDGDAVLARSVDEEPTQNPTMPMWKYTTGTEHEALPFGQAVPCYRSIEGLSCQLSKELRAVSPHSLGNSTWSLIARSDKTRNRKLILYSKPTHLCRLAAIG